MGLISFQDAAAAYPPLPLEMLVQFQALQDQIALLQAAVDLQVGGLHAALDQQFAVQQAQHVNDSEMLAHAANSRIITRNVANTEVDSSVPLYKSVSLLLCLLISPVLTALLF